MSDGFILAIDQGTTNTKALLVARDGQPVFRTSTPISISTPQPGWVEQDALDIWETVLVVIQNSLSWAVQHSSTIAGISISNQRETVVAWHRGTGIPVAPAILWQCRRSTAICDKLRLGGHESLLRERTGLGIDPLFSASKMQWLCENVPGLRAQVVADEICFGTVDSWLIWKLTQGTHHCCDTSNASRTQLLNLKTCDWDGELLALFGIQSAALPEIFPSSGFFGECKGIDGLAGVPIVSAIGDSHAALAGHACFAPGTVKATYGTGSSLMTLLPGLPRLVTASRLANTIAWSLPPAGARYALEGNISMTGSALQWVGEFLGLADPVNDAAALATSVKDAEGVYFVPAMVGLGAPHWDNEARGLITGLGRSSNSAHLALAALEAIAFQVRDVLDAAQVESGCTLPALYADGGATRNDWLMQFQADVIGRPVIRSGHADLSALGTSWLGGLALGWWSSTDDLAALKPETTAFSPGPEAQRRSARYAEWLIAVQRARLQGEPA
jgi:glycerol kinase